MNRSNSDEDLAYFMQLEEIDVSQERINATGNQNHFKEDALRLLWSSERTESDDEYNDPYSIFEQLTINNKRDETKTENIRSVEQDEELAIKLQQELYEEPIEYRNQHQILLAQNELTRHRNTVSHPFALNNPQQNNTLNISDTSNYEDLLELDEQIERKGLSKQEISSFPVYFYNNHENIKNNAEKMDLDECSICLLKFENKQKIKIIICTHKYHESCIDNWLEVSRRCPTCMKDAVRGD